MRRQEDDLASLVRHMQDFDELQSHLYFLLLTFLARYVAAEGAGGGLLGAESGELGLSSLLDDDVTQALGALAATYETASRGLVYEHRPQSLPADRLAGELKTLLAEVGKQAGTAFDRNAAVVLRRLEEASKRRPPHTAGHDRRGFLDLVVRVIRAQSESRRQTAGERQEPASRLILP